jgi:uncharacterized protein YgbK (DUF1537 family)
LTLPEKTMKTILLGCIADDFTGATDLANNLVRAGMRVVQTIGVPDGPLDAEVDAVVVALKSRTVAPADAVAQSLAALRWLQAQGAQQIYFKYCSTFDSTAQGNIGPVTEVLMDALKTDFSIATRRPSPTTGAPCSRATCSSARCCSTTSGMQNHPLTPMTDANLVRVMQAQTRRKVGLIDHKAVAQGEAAIRARIDALKAQGVGVAIVDAVSNDDLLRLGPALKGMPLVTGRLGRGDRPAGELRAGAFPAGQRPAAGHRAAGRGVGQLLAGDQPAGGALHRPAARPSRSTRCGWRGQRRRRPRRWPGPRRLLAGGPVLVYSTAEPAAVKAVQAQLGVEAAGAMVERTLAEIARGLVDAWRAPAGRGRRRNLGRLRAGAGHHADADRPADRPRRAVVPCASRAAACI